MRRAASVIIVSVASVMAFILPAQGATEPGPAEADSYGSVRNILPPGQRGTVDAFELLKVALTDPIGRVAVQGKNAPKNFADQLELYDALATKRPSEITESVVNSLYKDAGFVPDEVVSTTKPRPGVTIQRDSYGVPFITGKTYEDTMFGAGYAGAKDRMFLMDVLRHAGAGRAAEFVGGTEANIAMDRNQVRTAFYTREEAAEQLEIIAAENGAAGERLLRGADAYLAGINAAQKELCPFYLPIGIHCPAEYVALQKKPTPWTRADLTYIASLVGGIFGKGGGQEFANGIYYQKLVDKFGADKAQIMFAGLREKTDAEAPTTSTLSFPYDNEPFDPTQPGVAIPDLDGPTASGTGDPVGSSNPLDTLLGALKLGLTGVPAGIDAPSGTIDLSGLFEAIGMSNALLVGADTTTTGHPLAVFGPQTGYFSPQLLSEQVLMGPGVMARGVSFAGTQLVVQLGHGVDYAWSATSAGSDNVDTVAERLCNADGSAATVESTSYVKDGECVPMTYNVHRETIIPNITAPELPTTLKMQVWRTHHGIVQTRATVDGVPVAIVLQRSSYGREAASILGFSQMNNPNFVTDAESFQRAASNIEYTFNWFYADNEDIGYFSSGRLPIRAEGTDTDLPRWGDAQYDWQGWLPFARHVQEINPPNGYLASWNNKPADDFAAADGKWSDGSIHRSQALSRRAEDAIAAGKISRAQLVGIVEDAATEDLRAKSLLPILLEVIGDDPETASARQLLADWYADEAHRVDYERDGTYGHESAIAIFDTWWEDGDEALAYDFAADGLGRELAKALPQPLDNHPRLGQGSAWLGSPWYSYIDKDLRQLTGQPVASPLPYGLCGGGDLAECRSDLRDSLAEAVDRVMAAQDVSDPADLTYDKSIDFIRHSVGGVVGVRPIDWQNRPTFQQVVDYRRHRVR